MTDTASAAPTYEQVIAAWNARADKYNQWGELGEDEKIEWAVACAKATPPAVVEPAELRQRAAQDHADRKTARAAVVAMSDERCVELSKGTLTAKQARKKLLSMARFTPCNRRAAPMEAKDETQ